MLDKEAYLPKGDVEVVYPWNFYGTDLSTFVQHFVAKLQTNKTQKGQKPHNSVYTYLLKVYICLQNIWWTDLEFIQATHKSNFSSSLHLIKTSYIG